MRRSMIVFFVMTSLIMLSALSTQAQFGRIRDALDRSKKAADAFTPITTEQEIAMGKEVAARSIAFFKVWENEKAAAYVRKVGEAVAMQSDRQDVKYYFELLDTDDVNAFAAPGGYIFVTRGLLDVMTTEAQLAGVLGHEVGHIAGKHIVNGIQRDKAVQVGIKEAGAFSPGSAYLNQIAGQILIQLMDKPMSQADENDADRRGVMYAHAAGYRADGLKSSLEAMHKLAGPNAAAQKSWLERTHPPLPDRIKHVERIMAEQKMQSDGRSDLAQRYTAAMSK